MKKDRKTLVTGGTGFIGSWIVDEMLRREMPVIVPLHKRPVCVKNRLLHSVHADLGNYEECYRICRGLSHVVHAAGNVGAAGVGVFDILGGVALNLTLTLNMLRVAWEAGVEKFILFGSSTGYPAGDEPQKEEDMWKGDPHPSYLCYGWMRRYMEKLGEYVASKSRMQVIVVRPSAVYGPRDNFDPASGHVIPSLIRRAVEKENPFVVWGTGDEIRDFVHVSDFARGTVMALEKCKGNIAVNIGYGSSVTIKDVVGEILKASGHEQVKVMFDASKPTAIPVRRVDISLARRILGYDPEISLKEGIRHTVSWYVRNACEKAGGN